MAEGVREQYNRVFSVLVLDCVSFAGHTLAANKIDAVTAPTACLNVADLHSHLISIVARYKQTAELEKVSQVGAPNHDSQAKYAAKGAGQ